MPRFTALLELFDLGNHSHLHLFEASFQDLVKTFSLTNHEHIDDLFIFIDMICDPIVSCSNLEMERANSG
jgi:hypothetical protein